MPRKTGYLANILNVPPLIFRFQVNPELMSEKKSFKYNPKGSFGTWKWEETGAAKKIGKLVGLYKDLKDVGSVLVRTEPLEAEKGDQRTFALDFKLYADNPNIDGWEERHGGSLEPDLATLRSFMNPSVDLIDVAKAIFSSSAADPGWKKPPTCDLIYGGLSVECVMTDLNIKMTAFFEDGTPSRADVSVTLKEQTFSVSTVTDWLLRHVHVGRTYANPSFWTEDAPRVTPGVRMGMSVYDQFS